jgi:hypothetical protein
MTDTCSSGRSLDGLERKWLRCRRNTEMQVRAELLPPIHFQFQVKDRARK